jgi:hypothetical protein
MALGKMRGEDPEESIGGKCETLRDLSKQKR